MTLPEAKQFVARFADGDCTPVEHEAFLRWLKGATIEEFDAIADEYETLEDQWPSFTGGPSSRWVDRLEWKLDGIGEGRVETPVRKLHADRFIRRRVWIAAASVIVVLS